MSKAARVPAIDVMRGFVIVLMALDHVRDYFGPTMFDPTGRGPCAGSALQRQQWESPQPDNSCDT